MNPFRIFRLSPHVLAILGLATSAFGVTSATITGRVTDPSGAVVPGTKDYSDERGHECFLEHADQ